MTTAWLAFSSSRLCTKLKIVGTSSARVRSIGSMPMTMALAGKADHQNAVGSRHTHAHDRADERGDRKCRPGNSHVMGCSLQAMDTAALASTATLGRTSAAISNERSRAVWW